MCFFWQKIAGIECWINIILWIRMSRKACFIIKYLILLWGLMLLVGFIPVYAHTQQHWKQLAPGLGYRKVALQQYGVDGQLQVFRIDLKHYRLHLGFAKDLQLSSAYVKKLAEQEAAVVAINGGFFSPRQKPLGLRIANGAMRSPIKKTSWWGIFYIKHNIPHIVSVKHYKSSKDVIFAIQSGPMLVRAGKIVSKLKGGFDERSVIGFDKKNRIIIAITEDAPLATKKLARILQKGVDQGGLGLRYAMNLDGGSSAQLYAKVGAFHIDVANISRVTDAILVIPKQQGS